MIVTGDVFVDATGDADAVALSGAPFEKTERGRTQPVTLEIRVGGVQTEKVRQYICDHPKQFELEMIRRRKFLSRNIWFNGASGFRPCRNTTKKGS
jgi:hypothetical protein